MLEAAISELEGPEEEMREARLRLEADFSTIAFSSDSTAVRGIERIERAAAGLAGVSAAERAVLTGASYARYWTASQDAGTFVAELEPLLSRENALDEQGRLRIIDRKKEILIDEHGHNTAPAPIESALKSACLLIGHVCLVGEGRPYLTALILLEPAELASDPQALAQVADAIRHLNASSDPRERIQRHTVLTAPWLPGEELTETLKLRRRRIAQKHVDTIEAMY